MSDFMIDATLLALWQTIYMVVVSSLLATLGGVPLGIALSASKKNGLVENKALNRILAIITNAVRSIPFIILLIAILPLTRLLVGTTIGSTAALVPLTLGAIPFVARIVESAIDEVNPGLIEAGLAMGATAIQIIRKILIPEALSPIIKGITVIMVSLVGYSAMAGAIGGGGLGDLAIRYGYQRFDVKVMVITVLILIALVQLLQMAGDKAANFVDRR